MEITRIVKLNEITYTEVMLSIDVDDSYGKIEFHNIKGLKSMDYFDGNTVNA
jgi:hypothetical protein